jgi:ubiquinone/menaquinone biosynthesis C-methylase UbiE
MLAAGYHCQAVERSPQMVAAARETLQRRKVGTNSTVIQGSAQGLPFNDASFDTVVSTFPSEYIYESDTIAEVSRVLRPGGRLIVIEGANLLPTGFLQPLLVFIQMLVYGPSAVFGPRKERNLHEEMARHRADERREPGLTHVDHDTGTGTTTDEVPDAWFGQLIPLEQNGLRRRSQRVRSRRWEVYITIGEKP